MLSLQSNRDVPLFQNIFRRYRQVSKRCCRKVHINRSRTLNSLVVFAFCDRILKSQNHETKQHNKKPSVQMIPPCLDSWKKAVFSCFLFTLPPPRPPTFPLETQNNKDKWVWPLKKKCQTSPTSERRNHRGVCVSCSPPAGALTSRGFSRASCGARKSRTNSGAVLLFNRLWVHSSVEVHKLQRRTKQERRERKYKYKQQKAWRRATTLHPDQTQIEKRERQIERSQTADKKRRANWKKWHLFVKVSKTGHELTKRSNKLTALKGSSSLFSGGEEGARRREAGASSTWCHSTVLQGFLLCLKVRDRHKEQTELCRTLFVPLADSRTKPSSARPPR